MAYPDAPVGTCKHCGKKCAPRRRTHDECRHRQSEANDYRGAAKRREGEKQRCVDCDLVEGQTRKVRGDFGGWKWERVIITRDHPQELIDNGPRDWTSARCRRCHNEKTQRERAERAARVANQARRVRTMSGRVVVAGAAVAAGVTWWLLPPVDGTSEEYTRVAVVAAVGWLVFVATWWLLARRHNRRLDQVKRLGDAIGRLTHTDKTRIVVRVRRWHRGLPVRGWCRYSSLFDDTVDGGRRGGVESLLTAKVGQPLDFTWRPHRDTVAWAPTSNKPAAELEVDPDDPTPVAPPTREQVVDRLHDGLAAALGSQVGVEVTGWHARNVPQAFGVAFPASARVHEDKMQDTVEDKVSALLPGTWRAEWRTTEDRVVFTDRPDPLAVVVRPPDLPEHVDLAALPMGMREDGTPWLVRLAGRHILIGGASGAGKGSVLWSLIRAVSPGVADGSVRLWGIDPKGGMELGRGRPVFEKFATDANDALTVLDSAVAFMRGRSKRYAEGKARDHVATPTNPTLVVVIDEIATLTKYGADKRQRDRVNNALGLLLSQGRAVGVAVVGALQDPRKDVLTLRDLFTVRIALRLNEPTAPDMLLGAGARAAGARADRIDAEHPGVGYMMVDGTPAPERFRAAWLSDPAIDALIARARRPAALPPVDPFEPVDVEDLADGDRIVIDQDGADVEVTYRGAVEDERSGLIEITHDDPSGVAYVEDAPVRRRVAPDAKAVYSSG